MIKKICFYVLLFFCLILNFILDFNIKNYIKIINTSFNKNIILSNKLYTLICSIIALILILFILNISLVIFKRKSENKGIKFKNKDGTHGTANWMQKKEMKQVLGIDNVPGIILGLYHNHTVKLPFDSYFNKNISVFGNSGSMKTTAFLLTNLLEISKYKKSIIVTDPKTEIYMKTSSYFSSIGYTVKVFNLKDMKHSDRWNPLEENETINDVQTSSSVIISNTQMHDGRW